MHHFVLMQTTFSFSFILYSSFSVTVLLSASHDSFSLPVVVLWGFCFFFPSSDCRKGFLLEKRPKVMILPKFGGDSPKTCIFPFTEDFPSPLPTILGDAEMRQLLSVQPSLLQQDTCSWVAIPGVIPAGAWCQAA